jgi:hypothetical protein
VQPYQPQPPPDRFGAEFRTWIADELRKLANAINGRADVLELSPLAAAPARLRDGMIVYANGSTFNPGAGAGVYERRGGAWVKL